LKIPACHVKAEIDKDFVVAGC